MIYRSKFLRRFRFGRWNLKVYRMPVWQLGTDPYPGHGGCLAVGPLLFVVFRSL